MFTSAYFTIILGILMASGHYCQAIPQERILNGTPVDTLRRFPYYVTIQQGERLCGGSIISDQWILTAMHCVPYGEFSIHFRMMNLDSASQDAFTLSVGDSSVIRYPTGYDNIALIKLPVTLKFSDNLAPIEFADTDEDYEGNSLVVLAGLSPEKSADLLTYGMFKLLPVGNCDRHCEDNATDADDTWFDPYLEICTVGWNNNNQIPCEGNEGSGLVHGWPMKPRLIGIFSSPNQCISGTPARYVKLSAYASWIHQTIKNYD